VLVFVIPKMREGTGRGVEKKCMTKGKKRGNNPPVGKLGGSDEYYPLKTKEGGFTILFKWLRTNWGGGTMTRKN